MIGCVICYSKARLKRERDNNNARCTICHKTMQLSTAGRSALTDHNNGKKYKDAMSKVAIFFKPHGSTPKEKNQTTIQPFQSAQIFGSHKTIDQSFTSSGILKAEIIWVLKSVVRGFSYGSCYELTDIFSIMYSDNDIAKGIWLIKTRAMYVITNGIAPHFKYMLKEEISESDIRHFNLMKVLMKLRRPVRWM